MAMTCPGTIFFEERQYEECARRPLRAQRAALVCVLSVRVAPRLMLNRRTSTRAIRHWPLAARTSSSVASMIVPARAPVCRCHALGRTPALQRGIFACARRCPLNGCGASFACSNTLQPQSNCYIQTACYLFGSFTGLDFLLSGPARARLFARSSFLARVSSDAGSPARPRFLAAP